MAPPGSWQSLEHRIRRAHPLRIAMARSVGELQHASADDLTRFQERRLRVMVRWAAARSPFYRDWFRNARERPRDIRTLADLEALPLLTRDHLVERPEDFRTYPRRLMWPAHSTGTSGVPVTVYRTPGASVYEMCALERQWSWFGLPPDPRRVVLRGNHFAGLQGGRPTKLIPGGRQLLVSSFHLTPENLTEIVDEIKGFHPHVIEGWPSSMSLLAALLQERDIRIPVRGIVTSSEVMSAGRRRLLREVFVGPIIDHYGQTERVALAGTCESAGFHIFSDYGIVELLPVAGSPDRHEVVGTALHNWGFPLFRYRTGDEVSPATSQRCECGRGFPLLGQVDGRVEDSFVALDGRVLPLPHTVIKDLSGVREAQIAELAPGCFEVRVVPGAGFDEARVLAQVQRNVDRTFGTGQEVVLRTVTALPRSASGKLKVAIVEHTRPAGSTVSLTD